MGWKALKDHFGIEGMVHIIGESLLIETQKEPTLRIGELETVVVICIKTGELTLTEKFRPDLKGKLNDLAKATDSERLSLLKQDDQFLTSIPVYTFNGFEIIEKYCESAVSFSNTHDGEMMSHKTHFLNEIAALHGFFQLHFDRSTHILTQVLACEEALKKLKLDLEHSERSLIQLRYFQKKNEKAFQDYLPSTENIYRDKLIG